jgi:hypothetical protein
VCTGELVMVQVELKLSHMILDNKIQGVLDQEDGVLVLYTDNRQVSFYVAVMHSYAAVLV